MEIITVKTKYSYFVHNVRTIFSLASLATGTQDLSISKNVQNSVQKAFLLTQNDMVKDLFKRLSQTLQASTEVKRRCSSDIYKSVP